MPGSDLFGTSGIRGDAEKLFTNQFCFDLGRTFAKFLDNHKQSGSVAIGNDPRDTSPVIAEGLIDGLVYEGRTVIDQGTVPSPAMCYILQVSEYITASMMVSGSHIKSELNGVKFFAFNAEIVKKHESEINSIYATLAGKVKNVKSHVEIETSEEAKLEYIEMLVNIAVIKMPKWKIVVDTGDGTQSVIIPEVMRRLGLNVVELNTTIQGDFFARDTENINDIGQLMAKVPEVGADFGIAYDADGDRAVFVDKAGGFIPGDNTASIIAKNSSVDPIVTPIATSSVVDHIGKKVIRTKVGSPHVVEAMKKHHSKLGFEANGGVFSGEIMYTRDGGSTSIKLLNIMARTGKTLEELMAQLPKYYLVKTKVDYKWELKDKIIEGAKKKFKGIKVEEVDGLKIWINPNTWLLFRSSLNAPEFRVFAESKEEKTANELLDKGISFVKEMIRG